VVLSEAPEAMPILEKNVQNKRNCKNVRVEARKLDWTSDADLVALRQDSPTFDVIVGTDVIFNTTLVEPLLKLLWSVAHANTTVWLCMQERCPDAHAVLMDKVSVYFDMRDMSSHLAAAPGCKSAAELECFLLRLTRRKDSI
jgi:predicted nicotinamide N-methyase